MVLSCSTRDTSHAYIIQREKAHCVSGKGVSECVLWKTWPSLDIFHRRVVLRGGPAAEFWGRRLGFCTLTVYKVLTPRLNTLLWLKRGASHSAFFIRSLQLSHERSQMYSRGIKGVFQAQVKGTQLALYAECSWSEGGIYSVRVLKSHK